MPIESLPRSDFSVICAFSRRASGNMSLSYGDTKNSLKNRKNFLSSLDIDYRDLICANQVHGGNVKYVKEKDRGRGALCDSGSISSTDALITDKRNLPLAIFTADCLPIFLYDPVTCAIGLIHSGWRSSKENIALKAIRLMQQGFNTEIANLYVAFGPTIRQCCYEVGQEFNDFFSSYIIQKNNRCYLDLVGVNKQQLLDLGAKETNIFDSKICTSCRNDEFFSFRKEGSKCGRMMSVIMLKGGSHGKDTRRLLFPDWKH